MGIKKALLYGVITLVTAVSPAVFDLAVGALGINISSFQGYISIVMAVALLMTVAAFIENYYVETKTVLSGIFGLVKHLTYIFWAYFTFQAFTAVFIPADVVQAFIPGASTPLVLNVAYEFLLTLILASLGIKLVAYLWQIAFYRDIQKTKCSEPEEIRGRV